MTHASRLLAAAVFAAVAAPASAADWPQFKGPNGSGVSPETGLPTTWSKDANVRWRAALPARGVSCPVVVGGRVYVTCSSGPRDDRLHVLAFDAATGKQLWHRQLAGTGGTAKHPKTAMAAPTPAADETGVYALFATGDVAAFDRDGSLRWYRSLVGDYPSITNQVGMAASIVLAKDRLLVPMENAGESFLAAIDAKHGTNVWKAPRPKEINWTTPVVRAAGGGQEVLFMSRDGLTAYDVSTGEKRWATKAASGTIPTPTADGGMLFAPAGGVTALKVGEKGADEKPLWKSPRIQTGMGSPLVYQGRVYAAASNGVIVSADAATGEVKWQERAKGPYSASPVAGDGKVYVLNETGTCTVLKAGGDQPEVLGTNELGEETLATPAIADGALFIRTDKALYCVGSKATN